AHAVPPGTPSGHAGARPVTNWPKMKWEAPSPIRPSAKKTRPTAVSVCAAVRAGPEIVVVDMEAPGCAVGGLVRAFRKSVRPAGAARPAAGPRGHPLGNEPTAPPSRGTAPARHPLSRGRQDPGGAVVLRRSGAAGGAASRLLHGTGP